MAVKLTLDFLYDFRFELGIKYIWSSQSAFELGSSAPSTLILRVEILNEFHFNYFLNMR